MKKMRVWLVPASGGYQLVDVDKKTVKLSSSKWELVRFADANNMIVVNRRVVDSLTPYPARFFGR